MPSYAAFLGHQPTVSLTELRATIAGFHLQRIVESRVAIFATKAEIPPSHLAILGGTVLLAEEIPDGGTSLDTVPQILRNAAGSMKGKVTFGLRCVGLPSGRIRTLYRACKDALRSAGHPCRYIGNERQPAHTALLRDSGILDGRHGIELVLISDEERLWLGKTIAAQNPTSYAKRDIGKPARDLRAGILPPKLAQMMLNLGWWLLQFHTNNSSEGAGLVPARRSEFRHAGVGPAPGHLALRGSGPRTGGHRKRKGGPTGGKLGVSHPCIVWDPFCGSGILPVECLLRGWIPLASDSSQKAVDACKRNIDWLRRTFAIPAAKIPSAVQKHNALKSIDFSSVRDERLRQGPTLIVTETSLGPSLRSRPTKQEVQRLRTENEKLQIAFLRNVASTFPGIPLVCTWPVWYSNTGPMLLEKVWKEVEKLGLEAVLPPETIQTSPLRPTLLYRRPDQYVAREIVLLRKKQ